MRRDSGGRASAVIEATTSKRSSSDHEPSDRREDETRHEPGPPTFAGHNPAIGLPVPPRLEVPRVDLLYVSFVIADVVHTRWSRTPSTDVLVRARVVRPREPGDLDLGPLADLARLAREL